ncbi:Yip1-domain-containing protein [Atractiella rhizophila]|nr:Yip1-domain-containing protein [Atractiella rhizophila]
MSSYYAQQPQFQSYSQQDPNLQFYSSTPNENHGYYRQNLEGNVGSGGSRVGGQMVAQGGFWSAFGTGGFEGEDSLMEELGINFSHIRDKSMTVLNPLRQVDRHIMDDADLAGPLIFVFLFAVLLLFAGKPLFSNIYGLLALGDISIYLLLNLMSPNGIDAYRTASVLGYCLLPMVLIGGLGVVVSLDGLSGYLLSLLAVVWCSYSSSGIFVSVLGMSEQRLLVAYPLALFYASFSMLSIFNPSTGSFGV